MKIIHTGDWHIGKVVNEMTLIEDQVYILDRLIQVLEEEKPDALVIAGDLYDRSVPPARAVEVLDSYLSKIVLDLKIPVLAIAGNHDSGERLDFGSGILKSKGLHIEGVLKSQVRGVTLEDKWGQVDFYLIPYADPSIARHVYEDEDIRTHEDAMKRIIEEIHNNRDKDRRAVIVAHGYVTFMGEEAMEGKPREELIEESNLEISDSERPLSIGGTDLISGKLFKDFNYVALGHLHGPQKVGSNRIRYAGSLLKYSFSEENQKKSVTLVDLDENGEVDIKLIPLIPRRDMRTIRGTLDYLISKEFYKHSNTEDYVFALLEDDGEIYEPMSKLRSVYPNAMGVRRAHITTLENRQINLTSDHRSKSKVELFKDFYENVTQKEFTEDRQELIKRIIEKVDREM